MNYQQLKDLADKSIIDIKSNMKFGIIKISDLISINSFSYRSDAGIGIISIVSAKLKIGSLKLWRHDGQDEKMSQPDKNFNKLKQDLISSAKITGVKSVIGIVNSSKSIDDLLHNGSSEDDVIWNQAFNCKLSLANNK
jgi:hypothetical protein